MQAWGQNPIKAFIFPNQQIRIFMNAQKYMKKLTLNYIKRNLVKGVKISATPYILFYKTANSSYIIKKNLYGQH